MKRDKILVIDDDLIFFEILQNFLGDMFYKTGIRHAETGEDGLAMMEKEKFSMALVDFYMPGMNGLQTIKAIRAQKRFKGLPLILITGYAFDKDIEKAVKKHAFACIRKQHISRDLKPIIKRILNISQIAPASSF